MNSSARRLIASYGPDRILIADLCDRNPDEWKVGNLLNAADLLGALLRSVDIEAGAVAMAKACNDEYCVEVEAVPGGFLAYEVPL